MVVGTYTRDLIRGLAKAFGEQKVLDAKLKSMSLVNHKIVLE